MIRGDVAAKRLVKYRASSARANALVAIGRAVGVPPTRTAPAAQRRAVTSVDVVLRAAPRAVLSRRPTVTPVRNLSLPDDAHASVSDRGVRLRRSLLSVFPLAFGQSMA